MKKWPEGLPNNWGTPDCRADRYLAYARRYNLRPAGGNETWERLLGKTGMIYRRDFRAWSEDVPGSLPDVPARWDHWSLWNRKGKPVRFLNEPYADATPAYVASVHAWAAQKGLVARIEGHPFLHMDGTILVELALAGEFDHEPEEPPGYEFFVTEGSRPWTRA